MPDTLAQLKGEHQTTELLRLWKMLQWSAVYFLTLHFVRSFASFDSKSGFLASQTTGRYSEGTLTGTEVLRLAATTGRPEQIRPQSSGVCRTSYLRDWPNISSRATARCFIGGTKREVDATSKENIHRLYIAKGSGEPSQRKSVYSLPHTQIWHGRGVSAGSSFDPCGLR